MSTRSSCRRDRLPSIEVATSFPTADAGGLPRRPAVDALGMPGLYLAGDWVGDEGMLADAAFAGAHRAAQSIIGSRQRLLPALAI